MMDTLKGKFALVTGASRGLGRAAAVALAKAGVDVAVNYLSSEKEAKQTLDLIKKSGAKGMTVQADVSKSKAVTEMISRIKEELGEIDILVNNAGIAKPQEVEQITEKDWDEIIDINLKSAFLCTQAVLPGMRRRRWGRIINMASMAAQVGGFVGPHYSASKAGMLGLTHSYATFLVKEGITVNAINPAVIETDLTLSNPRVTPDIVPVGRLGMPEEVAAIILLLAQNGFMTGQSISINGGLYFT